MSSYASKSASKRPAFSYPTQWSEWEWWEESQCYRRWRLNAPNDYDVQYGGGRLQETSQDVPRTITQETGQPTNSAFSCTWPDCQQSFPNLEQRDRHYQTVHANKGERPHTCDVPGCQAGVQSFTKEDGLRGHNKKWHGPYHCPQDGCVRGFPNGFGSQVDLDSHLTIAHGKSVAPSTYTQQPVDPTDLAAQDFAALSIDDAPVASNATVIAARNESATTHIQASDPSTAAEKFDKNYRVHAGKEFRWGKVFKLLWTEPRGSGQGSHLTEGTYSARHIRIGKHDETLYEKVRRFVIISSRRGHCLCLPINTYSGQGTNKYGVHAEDHAVIYTDKPYYLKGEWEKGMTKDPIRVIPTSGRHKLDRASRLNYAKVYTIECNVKVWFIGKIHPDSENKLVADYNRVHPPVMAPSAFSASPEDTVAYATGQSSSSYFSGGDTEDWPRSSQSPYLPHASQAYISGASSYARGGATAWNPEVYGPTRHGSFNSADNTSSYRPTPSSSSYISGNSSYASQYASSGYVPSDETSTYYQPLKSSNTAVASTHLHRSTDSTVYRGKDSTRGDEVHTEEEEGLPEKSVSKTLT